MKSKLLVFAGVAAALIIGLATFKGGSEAVAAAPGGEMPPAGVTVVVVNQEAGQQLYQIDPSPFQAVYESAKAELMRAEANLSSTAPKAERYAELVKDGGVSKQEFDDANASYLQAQAAVAAAKAAVRSAEINLTYTRVLAPISGHIGKSSVTEGALVSAGQGVALARVQQLDKVYVDVNQPAEEILKLRKLFAAGGKPASSAVTELIIDGAEYAHKGAIQFSDVSVDEGTGMIQIRAIFPNPDGELLPGLFVKARVAQAKQDAVILVPQQSAIRQANGSVLVFVVDEQNVVNPRPVELGDAVGNRWVVLSGLNAGEKVMIEGFQKIRPGAQVSPTVQGAK